MEKRVDGLGNAASESGPRSSALPRPNAQTHAAGQTPAIAIAPLFEIARTDEVWIARARGLKCLGYSEEGMVDAIAKLCDDLEHTIRFHVDQDTLRAWIEKRIKYTDLVQVDTP